MAQDTESQMRPTLVAFSSLHSRKDMESSEQGLCLAQTYHQTGKWKETLQVCEWMLQTWSSGPALYLLVTTHLYLSHQTEALAVINHYSPSIDPASCPNPPISTLITAEKLQIEGDLEAAIGLYEQALAVLTQSSYILSMAIYRLGELYRSRSMLDRAEQLYQQAATALTSDSPGSLALANCWRSLGQVCDYMQRFTVSESSYLQACRLYETQYIETIEYADCLHDFAMLYDYLEMVDLAEARFLEACERYQASFPRTLNLAKCLLHLANFYLYTMNKLKHAEKCYFQASLLFSTEHSFANDYPNCLRAIGHMFSKNKNLDYAEIAYVKGSGRLMKPESYSLRFIYS